MTMHPKRWARSVALLLAVSVAASCGLPRSGPNKREIYSGSVQRQGDAFIVSVNDRVTRATGVVPSLGFAESFKTAGIVGSDIIRPGDTLGLTIWENVDDGLLASETASSTVLEEVQVDGAGFIFVPYAGRIKAAGNTTEAVRRVITRKLEDQTPDPQVEIRREAGDGSTVSIIGSVGGQGVYAIERPTRTLSAMLARAGGVTIEPEIAQITVTRGGHSGKIWFQDLYGHPDMDIALRGGTRSWSRKTPVPLSLLAPPARNRVCPSSRRPSPRSRPLPRLAGFCPPPPIRPGSSCSATSPRKLPRTSWAATIFRGHSAWSMCST